MNYLKKIQMKEAARDEEEEQYEVIYPRAKYTAILGRPGNDNTRLLKDIKEANGLEFRNHTWLQEEEATKNMKAFNKYNIGTKIEFTAVAYEYNAKVGKCGLMNLNNIKAL